MKFSATIFLMLMLAALPLLAASSLSPAGSNIEKQPIFASSPSTTLAGPQPRSEGSQNSLDVFRVALALAVVMTLVFFLRWAGQRIFPSAIPHGPTRAVQVLSRTMLAPKQSVVLLRVGGRVLVVADTGSQLTSLCQISKQEEVAALLGQIQQEKTDSVSKAFGQLFHRTKDKFIDEVDEHAKPQGQTLEPDQAEPDPAEHDPALRETRDELDGLAKKVRQLSGRFRSSPADAIDSEAASHAFAARPDGSRADTASSTNLRA